MVKPYKVAIIILNWNGWQDTIECLKSINEVVYENIEVVVIDNGSNDESVNQIAQWCRENKIYYHQIDLKNGNIEIDYPVPQESALALKKKGIQKVILGKLNQNMGFCRGNNIGIQIAIASEAEVFLILNNDTVVTPHFLSPLVQLLLKNKEIGIVSPKIYYYERPREIWYVGGELRLYPGQVYLHRGQMDEGNFRGIFETAWCSGCAMLIRREVIEKVGMFDEAYFIWSEEVDLSLRARNAGYRLAVNANTSILHKEYRSLGRRSPGTIYYSTRNRLLLAWRYWGLLRFSIFLAIFLAVRVARTIQFVLKGDYYLVLATWEAVLDFLTGRYGQWRRHNEVYKLWRKQK